MDTKERSEIDSLFPSSGLTSLVDLQRFLRDEIGGGAGSDSDLQRAFTPLTDGLGIGQNPRSGAVQAGRPSFVPSGESAVTELRSAEPFETELPVRAATRLFLESEEADQASDISLEAPPTFPPTTLFRRFLAGFVDQCFVLTILLVALAITSNALSGTNADLGTRFLRELSSPAFLKSAALEFGVVWLGYLALSVALSEATFGMWVWGLRFNFGESKRFWKKLARTVMAMFFYPFVFPTVLLVFQREGTNLVDAVTQSRVYRG
jgi:uncharacterized RDD family membrane protein YckC